LKFSCTYKYYHAKSAPTTYTLYVRANPRDFHNHAAVRSWITPYLESLGRQPEFLWRNLNYATLHAGKELWGGNSHVQDILIYRDTYRPEEVGEVMFHELAHVSVDSFFRDRTRYKQAIKKDCNRYFSSYARDHPERESIAESFLLYWGARYRKDRLQREKYNKILTIAPNRLKLFAETIDSELTILPYRPTIISQHNYAHVSFPSPIPPRTPQLTPQEEAEALREYAEDGGYFKQ